MSGMTGWKVVVNFLLPPPLLLTLLLVIPFPRNVRKGILLCTHQVLNFTVAGGMKMVHFALILSGIPFIDSGMRTFHSAQAVYEELRPDMRTQLLAKKWRDERNFWIAAMAFTMWGLLSALASTVARLIKLEDRSEELQRQLDEARGVTPAKATTNKMKVAGAVAAAVQHLGLRMPQGVRAAAVATEAPAGTTAVALPGDATAAAAAEAQEELADAGEGEAMRTLRSRARRAAA